MQEFFRVAAEIADHQAHIARKPSHVVVKLRIGKEFSKSALSRVELRRDVANVRGCVAQIGEHGIVSDQFPERALSIAYAGEQRVGIVEESAGLCVKRRIVDELAETSLLGIDGRAGRLKMAEGGVKLIVKLVRNHHFAQGTVPCLNVGDKSLRLRDRCIHLVVHRRVVDELAYGPLPFANRADNVADLLRQLAEVRLQLHTALDDLLHVISGFSWNRSLVLDHLPRAARDVDVTIPEKTRGHKAGFRIGAYQILVAFIDAHVDLDVLHAVSWMWIDAQFLHVPYHYTVQAHRRRSEE